MVTIRPVCLPDDRAPLLALDRSFTTDRIYRVARSPHAFVLEEVPAVPAVRKEFPLADDLGRGRIWEHGVVAEQGGALAGFAAWTHQRWNRRTEVWHLYVAPAWRGRGIGRALMDAVVAAAEESAMRAIWLETSNLAYPAIQFYEHLGFSLCGLDTSLYDPADHAGGETAPVPRPPATAGAGRRRAYIDWFPSVYRPIAVAPHGADRPPPATWY